MCSDIWSQNVPTEKYTSKNGLISDRITAIAQDEKGFMWFGSFFGICRYDGIKFEKIALPVSQQNKYVNCLLSVGHKMYAGISFGGGLAEYENGKVNSYFINTNNSVNVEDFTCLAVIEDGSILLGSNFNKVYRFENGNFTYLFSLPYTEQPIITGLKADKNRNIWVSTQKGLFIAPFPYQRLNQYYKNDNCFSLNITAEGKMFFNRNYGTNITEVVCTEWKPAGFTYSKILGVSSTSKVVSFSGNTATGLWGIDYTDGLTNTSSSGARKNFNVAMDFTTDLNIVFADRENNLWIANEPGIIKVSNFNIQHFLFDEIAAGGSSVHLVEDSIVYTANSKSLFIIQNNSIRKTKLDLLKPDYYGMIHEDQLQNVWIGMWNGGLWRTRWKGGNLLEEQFFSTFDGSEIKVNNGFSDSGGNTWFIGFSGIYHVRGNRIIDHFLPKNKIGTPAFVNSFTIDEENKIMWLGENSSGIIKVSYAIQQNQTCTYKVIGYLGDKDGLTDCYVRSTFLDHRRNLWVGTRFGGIYKIRVKGQGYSVTSCNQDADLTCTRVTDIVAQDSTAVWFATCDGVYRYLYSNNLWQHFNTSNGILNAEIFRIAIDAKKNFIWASSSQGITKLQINNQQKTEPPLISITSVIVLGKPDSTALLSNRSSYSYNENSIGFSYTGASFIDEKKIHYKYLLEGHETNWSVPVFTNSVNYASLPPGKYTFKVIAANAQEQWSYQPAIFQFEIVRPFYKSPALIFLAITLGIFIIYMIRIQRLKQRFRIEKIRLNIARDLHDDIGSSLGSINLLSKNASRRIQNQSATSDMGPVFQKIGESAENTLEAMDDIVWSINPNKDKVNDLLIRMREFAIPLFEVKNMKFDFRVNGDKDLPIPMNLRRNIFLIYKESIHNILKHAGANKVLVELHITHQQFKMTVMDDGKGFQENTPTTRSNGLKNMQGRAEAVNGKIKFQSAGTGTKIDFEAPIR